MDSQRQIVPRDPRVFPGAVGKQVLVRANYFDMKFSKNVNIRKFEVVASKKNSDGSFVLVESRKLFSLFKNNYDVELRGYDVVEGYPTKHGIIVYTVPCYPHNTFPEKQDLQNRFIQISAERRDDIQINEWQNFDNELKKFLKRAAEQSLAQLYTNHGYTLMKKGVYSFETDPRRARFPRLPLNNIFDLLFGILIFFETNVPRSDGTSRNMYKINSTQTVCTRTNIPLFDCYLDLCTLYNDARRILHPGDLHGQLLDATSVSLLNRVFANIEVYIDGEEQVGGRHVLYKFVEICNKSSTRFFVRNDGRNIFRFFEDTFNTRLEFPTLNAVKVRLGKSIKHVPMELICISDRPQRVAASALNILKELTQDVKKFAAIVPGPKFEFIQEIAEMLHESNEGNIFKKAGIVMEKEPIDVYARVLTEPYDTYRIAPLTLALPFKDPVDYVIIDFHRLHSNRDNSIEKDVDVLMEKLYNFGIYVVGKKCSIFFQCNSRNAETDLNKVVEWNNDVGLNEYETLLFIVIVDNESNSDLYKTIKQKLDKNGMINQVITVGVLQNTKVSYRETSEDFSFNIALSINAKLGGVNCVPTSDDFDLWNEEINSNELTMFIGIDTVLSPQKKKLGLVGITTSINNIGTRYNYFAIMTNGIHKYCSNYKDILYYALNAYEGANGDPSNFPTKIVIFRAGMNEYELVKGEGLLEITQIKNIIQQYVDEYGLRCMPLITYIGYHRSHGARFYDRTLESRIPPLKSDTDLEGLKLNLRPGTVIDDKITNPNCFYFVSHETFMGTTKPAKYIIVNDEIKFKADNLLAMVYQLCRLMPQTNRSYRKPIPNGLAGIFLKQRVLLEPNLFDERGQGESLDIHPRFFNLPYFI